MNRTPRKPDKAGHERAVHSWTPKIEYAAAVIQYCSAGFSKYLIPLSRGVIQSPLAAISRGISAYLPSSGCIRGRQSRVENQIAVKTSSSATARPRVNAESGKDAEGEAAESIAEGRDFTVFPGIRAAFASVVLLRRGTRGGRLLLHLSFATMQECRIQIGRASCRERV